MPHIPITFGSLLREWRSRGLRVVETVHAPGTMLATHLHEHPSITVVMSGCFEETVGTRTHRCGSGLILFKPAGHAHSNRYRRRSRSLILEYECRDDLPHASTTVGGNVAPGIGPELHRELAAGNCESVADLAAELAEHLCAPARCENPPWMRTALDTLRDGFAGRIGLQEVAAVAGVHPVYLARVFRREQGCSVGTWVRRRRVHESLQLLRRSRRTVAEIALAVGFCDQAHFSHAFRREVGLTPARYRAMAS